jgi:hypothetical protein
MTEDDIDAVFAVNVKVPFVLVGELAPAMARRGKGAIVSSTGRHRDADPHAVRAPATGLTCSASHRSKSPATAPHSRRLPVRGTSIRTLMRGRPRRAIMRVAFPVTAGGAPPPVRARPPR